MIETLQFLLFRKQNLEKAILILNVEKLKIFSNFSKTTRKIFV